jgi:hypothetical protein
MILIGANASVMPWLSLGGIVFIGPLIIWTLIRFGSAMIQEET